MSVIKILIVDDEINILKSLKRALDEEYTIQTALGPEEAIKVLKQEGDTIHLVLTDFMMPIMSGEELYYYIAKEYPHLAKKVIFMTGGRYSGDIQKFFDLNPIHCIPKPLDHEELLELIKRVSDV